MRHEPAKRANILLDAIILNLTSKSLNMQSYTGLLTWNMKGSKQRDTKALFKSTPWDAGMVTAL